MAEPTRDDRIDELIARCATSRSARREKANWMKLWYMRGTDAAGPMARHNKIATHLDLLASYLYAPESTRFALAMPADQRSDWLQQADIARDTFYEHWRNSGDDVGFATALLWSLVYGSMIAKIIPSGHGDSRTSWVWPGDFGVLREDIPSLDEQEVLCHWFALSMGQIERLSRGHPDQPAILRYAQEHKTPGATEQHYPNMVTSIIATSVQGQPNWFGSGGKGVTNMGTLGDDRPQSDEPLVECVEVWEKSDFRTKPVAGSQRKEREYTDYWVTTRVGEWDLLTRRNPVLPWEEPVLDEATGQPSELPFVALVPQPLLDYFWGKNPVMPLVQLQALHEETLLQLTQLQQRQVDTSGMVSGAMGLTDEKVRTLATPGSWIMSTQPGAKIDTVPAPEVNDKLGAYMDRIGKMFDDQGGIPEILAGAMGAGARSGDQVSATANIAVGRIRRQALIVEDALEVLATRKFHLLQRHDDTSYPTVDGKRFLLSQLPAATTVKVSAHSSSPVYRTELKADADRMIKAGAIDLVDYVDLLDPPNKDELKAKARELQKAKAELVKQKMQIEAERAKSKKR